MKKSVLVILLMGLTIFQFCNQPEKTNTENPKDSKAEVIEDTNSTPKVERSELAILMRDLYNHTKAFGKDELPEGKPFSKELFEKYQAILTATPTDEKNKGEVFESYGKNFLTSLEVLTHQENVTYDNYNNMVSNCLACHSQHCPGPMLVIRKMSAKDPNAS